MAVLVMGPAPHTPEAARLGFMEGWIWNGVRGEYERWEDDRRERVWEVRSESQDLTMVRKKQWRDELEGWMALLPRCCR
ncbi:unnamed protein product [Vitrella brassicaformis CCMP3155]|uniref:Uncharacterized protein n=1 Tax=Vitrella brassicaformis (strain CCMP3155) TaxID=1169540 RepID=A0A0G4EP49_VITBC|nr:unnamed protein product [Vitrella brassicaformis CCMP3155]|eukprot:CEL99587.1 unnamed protein product [Vitrella brassicaformis CCMP3155]